MALGPDDLVNYEFKQAFRGYAIDEVDDLLDRLADQLERDARDRDELRQRLRDTEARLAEALETESTLKRTLITAQQAAERALDDAREQADELRAASERETAQRLEAARERADELVQEAHRSAQSELAQSRATLRALEERVAELRRFEQEHRERWRRHLLDAMSLLDGFAPIPEPAASELSTDVTAADEAVPGPPSDEQVAEPPVDHERRDDEPLPWSTYDTAGSGNTDDTQHDDRDDVAADQRA